MSTKSLNSYLIIFLAFFIYSCQDTGTSSGDDDSKIPVEVSNGFGVVIDSTYFQLSYVHDSHISGNNITTNYNRDVYWPILDIDIFLNQPDTSSEIKKLLIFNEEGLGWEINRNELDKLLLDGKSKLELKNLQMNTSTVNYDQLFTLWFINDKNERSENYQFIVKGDLPFIVESQNYWLSKDTLEFESYVWEYNRDVYGNYLRGYNPLTDSDSISIQWLDKSFNSISSLQIDPESYVLLENESRHYLQIEPRSSEISYSYSTYSQKRNQSTYRLISEISQVLEKPGNNISIFKIAENSFRLLYHDDSTTIIITQHPTQPNELSLLQVFSNEQPKQSLFQFDIKQSLYNNLLNVYVDPIFRTVYYFNLNSELHSFDLTTAEHTKENEPFQFGNSYSEQIFPYGDHLLVDKGSRLYLFHKETKETKVIDSFGLSIDANSYYFSNIDSSLYAAENNRRFYKVKLPITENDPEARLESFYNPYNSSSSYYGLLGLHFDTRDTLLIHSSGLAIPIKNESPFTIDSIVSIPSFRSNGSVWFDDERTLVSMNDYGLINKYTFDGSVFTENGNLESFITPFSIQPHFADSNKFVLINQYYQGSQRPRAAMLQSFSLSDFQTKRANLKINTEYKTMYNVMD